MKNFQQTNHFGSHCVREACLKPALHWQVDISENYMQLFWFEKSQIM